MAESLATPAANGGAPQLRLMPYSMVVGQTALKTALELVYVAPRIGGVLLSGHRGTGKSTVVRAFAQMMYGKPPVTLPINATEDRVVGGWEINELLRGNPVWKEGLLEQAGRDGMLYVDEVNLLDDHIVNIILDVTSTGILVVQRDQRDHQTQVQFALVGTMNPSEGGLRPQLLDRFGLMVDVVSETGTEVRVDILQTVLGYDEARARDQAGDSGALDAMRKQDAERRATLAAARDRLAGVTVPREVAQLCVKVGEAFEVEGHRGDYVMALAARANAAIAGRDHATPEDVRAVAKLALQHRRAGGPQWISADTATVDGLVGAAADPPAPA